MGNATPRNCNGEEAIMKLTFVGKDPDSNPTGSPTIYRTDRGSWVVQGWVVTDPEALTQMDMPTGETCVEIPDRMRRGAKSWVVTWPPAERYVGPASCQSR
jgi:hypothetical protein